MPQLLFGGFLATILLAFYIWSIFDAIEIARCASNCRAYTDNMSFLLNAIGGLISATVVGSLGVTQPGDFPHRAMFSQNLTGVSQSIASYMPSAYILVWIVCGVVMVVYGFVPDSPNTPPALAAQAKVWLGTAIAAVYAYFGIKPNGQ